LLTKRWLTVVRRVHNQTGEMLDINPVVLNVTVMRS